MTINGTSIGFDELRPARTSRLPRVMFAACAVALVGSLAIGITGRLSDGDAETSRTRTPEEITRDLVDRYQIPRQALDPLPARTPDEITRDLVARYQIPRQTLDPLPAG